MSVTRESVLYDDFGHSILIRRRRGLKQLRIAVAHDGRVTVTAAQIVPFFLIQRFVERKREWITRTQESFRIKGYASRLSDEARRARFLKYRSEALVIVTERVQQLSQEFECSPGNITIRDQRTRWGSCSARGALSFNYRIVFLPEHLVRKYALFRL
jgi:predicted metal-dependent hydrolase